MVAAREDSWLLLSRYLTPDILKRFEEMVLEVLGESNPQVGLHLDARILAEIQGKRLKYSEILRMGLSESLALMAALEDQRSSNAIAGQEWANHIIGRLFEREMDWKLWASLSPILRLLAEASPRMFLKAVERDISNTTPCLAELFLIPKTALLKIHLMLSYYGLSNCLPGRLITWANLPCY